MCVMHARLLWTRRKRYGLQPKLELSLLHDYAEGLEDALYEIGEYA